MSLFNTLTHGNVRAVFTVGWQKTKVLLMVRRKIFCNEKKPKQQNPNQNSAVAKRDFILVQWVKKSSFQAFPTSLPVSFSKKVEDHKVVREKLKHH